jgi:hypothetical protein
VFVDSSYLRQIQSKMKSHYLPISIGVVLAISMLQSYKNGPANDSSPVNATGSPGGGSKCTTCHAGGSFGAVSIDFVAMDDSGNAVSAYLPDQVYQMNVTVSAGSGDPSAYGFQILALSDSDDENAGTWENEGSNVRISSIGTRVFAEHKSPSATNEFSMDWTAPASGAGSVSFYIGANAVNGNNNRSGDNAKLAAFTFEETLVDTTVNDTANGIVSLDKKAFQVYPNPVSDILNFEPQSNGGSIVIYNTHGQRVVLVSKLEGNRLDVSELDNGIYFMEKDGEVVRFLKL